MAENARVNHIINQLPLLNQYASAQLFNFLRFRLMNFGVIEDERKEKFDLTERFGNRPWLDVNALKLKASLEDAVDDWRSRSSRISEDRVRSVQHDLMQHLRYIYDCWENKMRFCREHEEHMLEKLLNTDAPPEKKIKGPGMSSFHHDAADNQRHAPHYWDRAGQFDHYRDEFPEWSSHAPSEQYTHQRHPAREMLSSHSAGQQSFAPGERYPPYAHQDDDYYGTQPFAAPGQDFHYPNPDPYARPYAGQAPYAHRPYPSRQFNEPMHLLSPAPYPDPRAASFRGPAGGCASRWEPPAAAPTWYVCPDNFRPKSVRPNRKSSKFRKTPPVNGTAQRETSTDPSKGDGHSSTSGVVPATGWLTPTGIAGTVVRVKPPLNNVRPEGPRYPKSERRESRKRKIAEIRRVARLASAITESTGNNNDGDDDNGNTEMSQ